MKVLVGSLNPVKIQAVKEAFTEVFGEVEVEGVSVDSKVSHTPWNNIVKQGAINRAKALISQDCDYAVGMEGGIIELHGDVYLTSYTAIIDRFANVSLSVNAMMPLPSNIVSRLGSGIELGKIAEDIVGEENVKQKGGISGYLTNNLILRGVPEKQSVIYALSKFLHSELWEE